MRKTASRYYYITFFFTSMIYASWHYDIIIFHYDTITSLIFGKCPHIIKWLFFHYFINSKRTIISLMTFVLFHLFLSASIIAIIPIMPLSHYYLQYLYLKLLSLFVFRRLLFHIFVSAYIIYILAIITLLFALFISNYHYYFFEDY